MKSFVTLLKNELKLNIRNMNMVIFAVFIPLVVLIILGFIYGTKPATEGASHTFMEQSFGALCCISICAGGLMGLPLVVSEYRERKILKRFQVTPVSPAKLLVVELAIYVIYCVISMLTLFSVAMLFWKIKIHGSILLFLGSWLLTIRFTQSRARAAGFSLRKITSLMPTPSRRRSLKRCAEYMAGQRGKRKKYCSALSISTVRTSWKFSRTDGNDFLLVRV